MMFVTKKINPSKKRDVLKCIKFINRAVTEWQHNSTRTFFVWKLCYLTLMSPFWGTKQARMNQCWILVLILVQFRLVFFKHKNKKLLQINRPSNQLWWPRLLVCRSISDYFLEVEGSKPGVCVCHHKFIITFVSNHV